MTAATPGRIGGRAIATLVGAVLLRAALASAGDAAPGKAGAYCPLPPPGQPAKCLAPAQARYEDFFQGVDRGEVDDRLAERVEADVAARERDVAAYDALSTLTHAYYALARRAAQAPSIDVTTRERLERWNALFARAYAQSPEDDAWREALHAAANDLHAKAPPVGLRCEDANGKETRCASTEGVLRSMDAERDASGVRGQLAALIARLFGGSR